MSAEIFIDNKYTRIYYKIIEQAKVRIITGYTETHHIIPRSLGGNNRKDNLVVLTAKEHYICHRLLTKMTLGRNRSKMWNALNIMIKGKRDYQKRYVPSGRIYQIVKEELREIRSKRFSGKGNPMYGKEFTTEHRAKLCEAAKYKIRTKTHNEKIRKALIGKPLLEDRKAKMREAHKYREKVTCEHCNMMMLPHLYIRWHKDNKCKYIDQPNFS